MDMPPKIYLFAFVIASLIQIFCMEKVQRYLVAYAYDNENYKGVGSLMMDVSNGDLTLPLARTRIEALLIDEIPISPPPTVVVQSIQRLDYTWRWRWRDAEAKRGE